MVNENIELNNLSAEQQMRQEKSKKLLESMELLPDYFVDSNDAYEVRNLIQEFKIKFNNDKENIKKSLVLGDYLLGRVLCDLNNEDYDLNSPLDKDAEIENFIINLCEQQKEIYMQKKEKTAA